MKKILIFHWIFFFTPTCFAAKAIVLVHKTAILKEKNINSTVVQYVNKGQEIFIHDRDIAASPYLPNYEKGENAFSANSRIETEIPQAQHLEFYETMDNLGRPAYIQGKHVKIIYNDFREIHGKITPEKFDKTDYRLKEPLREGYPIIQDDDVRAGLSVGLGTPRRIHYPYTSSISSEKYDLRKSFNTYWLNKVDWDDFGRFYYGWNLHFYDINKSFFLTNGGDTTELGGEFAIGPMLSYDAFRNKKVRFSYTGSLVGIWTRIIVRQTGPGEGAQTDQKLYRNYSLSPKIGANFQRINLLPGVDFYAQVEAQVHFGHKLNTSSRTINDLFWREHKADKIIVPQGGMLTVYLGIQNSF